jgi:hypothetical protein
MSDSEPIVCKPTPWFLFRALLMLVMFGVFAVLFYTDGSTGYREKNQAFYLHKAFQQANQEFSEMNADGSLTPEQWKRHAEQQSVKLPKDRSVLPADLELPMPWPEMLTDYERMKPLQWNLLWREYTSEQEMPVEPPEHDFAAGTIREQWVVFWICLALAVGAAFFLLRTLRRSITADAEGVTSQNGQRVPYGDLKRLDLRKWDTKGLAFLEYEGASGSGRIRIDGLTYGGFKKENDEPAERLMKRVRSNFSGEILEYTTVSSEEAAADVDSGDP